MPKKYGYVWEKMHAAVATLADHPGRIQERVLAAVMVAHTVIDTPNDFPPDTRERVKAIYERMTTLTDPEAGAFAASARAMSDDDAVEIAKWLVEVYFRVQKLSGAEGWMGGPLDPL